MHSVRRVTAFLLIVLCCSTFPLVAQKKQSLQAEIDKILAQPEIARGLWGVEIVSLSSGKTIYEYNSGKLFTPASNTKLFTTAATLALIGSNYRFRTTVETAATLDKYGRLNGDLLLVGRGDPNLSGRTLPFNRRTERSAPPLQALENLADQVVAKGVRYIDGDIVGDDSYYAFERYAEGWSQDDLVWEWGAPVSALTINDNVLFVNIQPADHAGERAFLTITPFADYYRVDNRVVTTPAGTGPRRIYVTREPGSNTVTLFGNIPLDDPGAGEALAIDDPADFAARAFRRMLEQRGVTIYGRPRTRHTELSRLNTITITASAPAGGGETPTSMATPTSLQPLVLASYESQPLAEDIRVILKASQNLHAELALRLLGREKGTAGTFESGLEVLRGFMQQAGIQNDEYAFYDGSGLSRENLVTPHAIVRLLTYASQQPWYGLFQSSLPVAGVDATLSDRMRNSHAQGHVYAKTGSLGHVNTLSGYADTARGDRVAFSVMVNNHNLRFRKALDAIDQIVELVMDEAPAPEKPEKNEKGCCGK
jgi:D-alanyl-D-alanine carboxypeptidase/D-alanyl-D-alanine-endopeptidase (penicillin-binding protein 4)